MTEAETQMAYLSSKNGHTLAVELTSRLFNYLDAELGMD